jgi:GntR family transcriptional regulator
VIVGHNKGMEPFIVERDSPLLAWGQVRRDLRRRIDDGEFTAGQRIPTESELTEQYAVSRVTIRRAVAAMVEDRYLESRRGSGTFVVPRPLTTKCKLDLSRPWREHLVTEGHQAVSRLVESVSLLPVPRELTKLFGDDAALEVLAFAREVHLVDRVPIGITESWTSDLRSIDSDNGVTSSERVVAECFAEIGFATTTQAELLRSYLDIPLVVVQARTLLAETGELVEYARTSWIGNRVRLAFNRSLTLGEIDSTHLVRQAVGERRTLRPPAG